VANSERNDLAVFFDFENIALGLKDRKDKTFDVDRVLGRLLEKGKVIVKRAYADWSRFASYTRPFHEAAIELIEIPKRSASGKNSADIRLCVDALDLCYAKEHIDTFVIVSGDSDFSPLVSKLRENGKRVIGLGLRGSTSSLLVANCDEFIFYESLEPQKEEADDEQPAAGGVPKEKAEALRLVRDTVAALAREGRDPIQASLVKDTITRKQPSFAEGEWGYRSFTDMLEDAQAEKFIALREDPRSGTYLVTLVKRRRRPRRKKSAAPKTESSAPASE
jgi:uncharacterized protein (TIGR00288 family)